MIIQNEHIIFNEFQKAYGHIKMLNILPCQGNANRDYTTLAFPLTA